MALTRRADRRERSTGEEAARDTTSPGVDSGSLSPALFEPIFNQDLMDALLKRDLLRPEQLEQLDSAFSDPMGIDLGGALVDQGILDEQAITGIRADIRGLDTIDLGSENPEPEALAVIPAATAREHFVLPITLEDGVLTVAMADQPLPQLLALLEGASGVLVRPVLAPQSEIRRAIDGNYRAIGELDHLVRTFEAVEETRRRPLRTPPQATTAEVVADDAPVVQVVGRILTQAMRDRASDVHIEPTEGQIRVRFRIDGALKEVLTLPGSMGVGLVSRIKIMAGMNIVERRRPQDGQLRTDIDGREVDVRVSTLATIWGEACVMRVLDRTRSVMRLSDLGMPDDSAARYTEFVKAPFGMVLCAGPTGSGKTTTLYATLSEISDPSRNVMTIEDPVEYVFPSVNQIQTNEQAGLTFATGLRSILRQDPDVILVGEIRDVETARIAVQSALTGHFVLSSLHATDSVSALHRFLDMGIESFLIASSVVGIVGQRLVRRICPSCKGTYELSDAERAFYEASGGPAKTEFIRGTGCNFCSGTGYQGRVGVYELLAITPEIKRLVVGWATQDELRRLAEKQGMRTLRQEAIRLVAQDVTTVSEVIRSIYAL
jgi:type IV pilus assembly protein PilB